MANPLPTRVNTADATEYYMLNDDRCGCMLIPVIDLLNPQNEWFPAAEFLRGCRRGINAMQRQRYLFDMHSNFQTGL
jgi:hypothetical protein